ncbi:MAG: dihydrolipoamide acetyltransferase family protein [Thermoanaerobaculales bacterium]
MPEFRMPALGADMDFGTITDWRVKPGDTVKKGDIVAVVETQKATLEVEIFQSGTVDQILIPPGTRVPVGTVLAVLRNGQAPVPQAPPVAPVPQAPAGVAAPPPVSAETMPLPAVPGARLAVSPFARRIASELGVELAAVAGSGPGGAVTEADVRRAATGARTAPAATRQAAMRAAIGSLMARSKREIPHYYMATDIDMTQALAWIANQNLTRPVADRYIPAALLLKAVAMAVGEVPEMNGLYVDGAFRASPDVHVGVAISLRGTGLIAPALHNVEKKSLEEVMKGMLDLVQRTRSGMLRTSEMSDSTITVTNLGERGVETVFGVIYAPQVALVGFGKIIERPWAAGGTVGARPVLKATLAADHRVSDGHRGGLYLAAIDRLLQEPEKL